MFMDRLTGLRLKRGRRHYLINYMKMLFSYILLFNFLFIGIFTVPWAVAQNTYETRVPIIDSQPRNGTWTQSAADQRWFSWTASGDGWYQFGVGQPEWSFTYLSIYFEHEDGRLTEIGSESDPSNDLSTVFFAKNGARVVFWIRQYGFPDDPEGSYSGNYNWRLSETGAPGSGVHDLNVSPGNVDVTQLEGIVEVSFRLTALNGIDPESLVGSVELIPALFSSEPYNYCRDNLAQNWTNSNRIAGTPQDGVYKVRFNIPRGWPPGRCGAIVYGLYVDTTTGERFELNDEGGPVANAVASPSIGLNIANERPDKSPPWPISISFTRNVFDFKDGAADMEAEVTLRVGDDMTGLAFGSLSMKTGERDTRVLVEFDDFSQESGSLLDGIYKGSIKLSKDGLVDGTLPLELILRDWAGNRHIYTLDFGNDVYNGCATNFPVGVLSSINIAGTGSSPLDDFRQNWDVDGVERLWGHLDDPDDDGLSILLEYAFDLSPNLQDNFIMESTSGSGMPLIRNVAEPNQTPLLAITFIRRTSAFGLPGITYEPEFSSDGLHWIESSAMPVVIPLRHGWERVTVTDVPPPQATIRMGRVGVRVVP